MPIEHGRFFLFMQRRIEEGLGILLLALAGGSVFALMRSTQIDFLVQPARIWFGETIWLISAAVFVWGWQTLQHTHMIWRLWRFLLVAFAITGINIFLAAGGSPWAGRVGGVLLRWGKTFAPIEIFYSVGLLGVGLMVLLFVLALPIGWKSIFGRRVPAPETPLSPLMRNLKEVLPPAPRQGGATEREGVLRRVWRFFVAFFQNLRARLKFFFERRRIKRPANDEMIARRPLSSAPKKTKSILLRPAKFFSKPISAPTPPLPKGTSKLPPLTLMEAPQRTRKTAAHQTRAKEMAAHLDAVLKDFNIEGEISTMNTGPVVTLFEFLPARGVKSSRIIGLADDIARSMSAFSARIANIPGQNAIGIEIPNAQREDVHLAHLLSDSAYKKSTSALPLILGTSISGAPVISDLATMPHLLVAGTTGSGKSVAINAMILSLLYRHHSDTCKLIMIDPKMLELSVYQDIPHLLTPVVTDPKKAVAALKWAVREMEMRYQKMAALNCRNIANYNRKRPQEKMPFIVIIIDEMADLMMVAGKDIEGVVQRLAQMARAAGIHLIAATQRPSVDVITGTIKANFPTRISFQVTSRIDSRTILGEGGAEQLLGRGDMLWMMAGGRLQRVHGGFVADDHVENVANFLRASGPAPDYQEAVITEQAGDAGGGGAGGGGGVGEDDDLYTQAIRIISEYERASTSFLQRKLQIGYNRAARLIERMEEAGLVSAPNHSGKREILMGKEDARTIR